MHTIKILCTVFILFVTASAEGQVVQAINWTGIGKTNTDFLEAWMSTKTGNDFSPEALEEDLVFLRNLQVFATVFADTNATDEGIEVTIHAKEVNAIIPLVGFGSIEENFYLELGVADYNAFGKTGVLWGKYTWYDRHSFELLYHNRFIRQSPWGFQLHALKRSTSEPVYFEDRSLTYDYDLYTLEVLPGYHIDRFSYLQTGLAFLYENYEQREVLGAEGFPESLETFKWLGKLVLTMDKRTFDFQYVEGWSTQTFLEYVWSDYDETGFFKAFNETRFFDKWGDRSNYAARLRLGISSNPPTPFPPFVVDSYVNIRGSGNRIARGTAELVLNQEWRYSILDRPWGGVQGVAFADAGTWRPAGESLNELYRQENMLLFTGLGGRLFFKDWFNAFFRADIGINPFDNSEYGLVLGFGQYF